jgi:hypothetical protein
MPSQEQIRELGAGAGPGGQGGGGQVVGRREYLGKIKSVAAECIQGFQFAGLGFIVADQYTRT